MLVYFHSHNMYQNSPCPLPCLSFYLEEQKSLANTPIKFRASRKASTKLCCIASRGGRCLLFLNDVMFQRCFSFLNDAMF